MNINANTVVSITYELHTTTPEGQQVFVEKANEEQPLVFLYGVGMMLPKFEEHLVGLKAGDEYSFELSPADGYGEIDATAHVDLPKACSLKLDQNCQMLVMLFLYKITKVINFVLV